MNNNFNLKIQTKNKKYKISDSALYNIFSMKKLSEILQTDIKKINYYTDDRCYKTFNKPKNDGGIRHIQYPIGELKRIHARIASLLSRIESPNYLHSGIKGQSYITNAQSHATNNEVLTIDIEKFFPSIKSEKIYNLFRKKFKAPDDVSKTLSLLLSYQNHIPTGSVVSMLLAFWSSYDLFNELNKFCISCNICMTVYVDDIAFSGSINKNFYNKIEKIINNNSLKIKYQKSMFYKKYQNKLITGIIVKGSTIKLRNRHHKATHEISKKVKLYDCDKLSNKFKGLINSGRQINPTFFTNKNLAGTVKLSN